MRLGRVRESGNVQDRRSAGPRTVMAGGGVGLLLMIGIVWLSGGNLGDILNVVLQQGGGAIGGGGEVRDLTPEEKARQEEQVTFVKKIVALTEDVWTPEFQQVGRQYQPPVLEIFRGATQTACGQGAAAMGPFYCPGDRKVYIDLSFYDQLDSELGAPGDFAQAYVIAHEVGHHIQNQLGYNELVDQVRRGGSEREANEASVRLELQADYLAGVWARQADDQFNVLEPGDAEEGLKAANQIGDDLLQKKATGRIVLENFTHGSSAQRVRWLREGLRTGDFSKQALDRFFEMPYNEL
jgi:predicted metalloprotease